MGKVIKFIFFCCFVGLLITISAKFYPLNYQQSQPEITPLSLQLTLEETLWLESHQTIRIAFDGNFPPYSYIDETGQLAGIAFDTIQLISEKLDIQLQIDPRTNWQTIYQAALAGEIDIIASMVNNLDDIPQFAFTSPYIFKSLVIITHKTDNRIKERNDLPGLKIALVKNYQYSQSIFNSLQNITPVYVDRIEDALLAVETQQVDAAVCLFAASYFLQNKHHFNNIQFTAFYNINSINDSIAIRKDWPILTDILQKGLNVISLTEKQALNRLWHPPIKLPTDYTLVNQIGISSLLVLSGLLIWLSLTKWHSKKAQLNLSNSNSELNKSIEDLENLMVNRTEQLHNSEKKYHTLIDKLDSEFFFYKLDLKGNFTYISPSIINVLGYSANQFLQNHDTYLSDRPDNAKVSEYIKLCLNGEKTPAYQMEAIDNNGNKHFLKIIESPLLDVNNRCIGLEGIAQDITLLQQTEEQLNKLTYYNHLTGMANKHLFIEHVEQRIGSSNRQDEVFTLLSLDLDGLKLVNEHFGHKTGDKALQEVASRLQSQLNDREIAAHIGGDEFILMLLVTDTNAAISATKKIVHRLLKPYLINDHQFVLGSRIGISIYPQDGTDSEILLLKADSAMAIAKNNNIAYALYSSEPDYKTSRKQVLEESLNTALEKNDFTENFELYLVYHSIHNILDKSIIAYEALIRWQHPELGLISPTELIPLAIETGLISELSRWVINRASLQANSWTKEGFSFKKIAINISTIEVVDFELPKNIHQHIVATGALPEWFQIEITELASVKMPDVSYKTINKLLESGIQTSLDNFGADASSLACLKGLPASSIKLDISLIQNIHQSSEDQAIVRSLISSFHTLGKKVIAVGVETQEQLQFLTDNHCDMAQGYHFSKPATPEEITNYISQIYN